MQQSISQPATQFVEKATVGAADALFASGRIQEAERLYMRLLAEGCSDAAVYFRLAAIANHTHRDNESLDWLDKAIAADPDNAEYRYALGRLYKSRAEPDRAEQAYRDAVRLRPDYLDAWVSLGVLLRNLQRLQEAEACQREAVRIDPTSFVATLNLGNALYSQGRLQEAASYFRQAVAQNRQSAEAHHHIGRALLDLHDLQSIGHFRDALALNPNYFEAAEGLGKAAFKAGLFDEAAAATLKAIRLNRSDVKVQMFLADVYCATRNIDAARAIFEQLLAEQPEAPIFKCGLAVVLASAGQYTKPRALFEQALAALPDDEWIRTNYALFLLRSGDYAKAWDYYDSRASDERKGIAEDLTRAQWRGEPLAGKSLLITCEQGLGDEIMFASIYGEIIREAGHCVLGVNRRLESLYRRSFPDATLIPLDRTQKASRAASGQRPDVPIDYWSPAGSLPRHRRATAEQFPKHSGYLVADAGKTGAWRARLQQLGPGLKVGISWRGGLPHTRFALRSLSLPQLSPVLSTQGVHWIDLQYGDSLAEANSFAQASGIPLHRWQEAIDDYDETAALVGALDLVISVCTAVVHLAGALGRPVWVLAPHVAEWRYGREGESMIWYPSVRMFRQPKPDAWKPLLLDVKRALQKRMRDGE